MRLITMLVLTFFCLRLSAQSLTGIVIDRYANLPVTNASITSSSSATITSASGRFRLNSVRAGDTLTISCKGYKVNKIILGFFRPDSLRIYLVKNSIVLGDVRIVGLSGYKRDSLRLRDEFNSAFTTRPGAFKDIFITKSSYIPAFQPYNKIVNGTASVISLDVLSVVKLFSSKKKTSAARLKKALLEEEENSYVDRLFTIAKITAVTPLRGDSLRDFRVLYRPSAKELKKMEAGDLNLYIMSSYTLFLRTYRPGGLLSLPATSRKP